MFWPSDFLFFIKVEELWKEYLKIQKEKLQGQSLRNQLAHYYFTK